MTRRILRVLRELRIAQRSIDYAQRRCAPGVPLARFGQSLGRRLCASGRVRLGLEYLVTPVSIVRYFEFPFVLDALPEYLGDCLDVSSPRLFALYVARYRNPASLTMLNPDASDLALTRELAAAARMPIVAEHADVASLSAAAARYDVVWSISVVEHIAGAYDDRAAVQAMFAALRPGGRLILTVPVDRVHRDEYLEGDPYGTQGGARDAEGRYFFQRLYDEHSVRERIIGAVGVEPTIVRWFGERERGAYATYEAQWLREGRAVKADDPRRIVDEYREFPDWQSMPGVGVCGIAFDKPAAPRPSALTRSSSIHALTT